MHKMNKVKSEKLQASYAIAAAQNLNSQFNVFIFQTLPNNRASINFQIQEVQTSYP